MSEFSHRYPQIKIDLQEGTTTQLTDKLVAEELDLLIDNSELDDKNYEKYYYSTERIILAVPKSFPINEELTSISLPRKISGQDATVRRSSRYCRCRS